LSPRSKVQSPRSPEGSGGRGCGSSEVARDNGVPVSEHRLLVTDYCSRATCRAGAVVLLVGFWFDGGLFKLATGATFWILLELGREDFATDFTDA